MLYQRTAVTLSLCQALVSHHDIDEGKADAFVEVSVGRRFLRKAEVFFAEVGHPITRMLNISHTRFVLWREGYLGMGPCFHESVYV